MEKEYYVKLTAYELNVARIALELLRANVKDKEEKEGITKMIYNMNEVYYAE